jgi:hypothetical protein
VDDELKPEQPKSRTHPTTFNVQLGRAMSLAWEASSAFRQLKIAEYLDKARMLGKKRVEVHGRYSKLGEFEVPEV